VKYRDRAVFYKSKHKLNLTSLVQSIFVLEKSFVHPNVILKPQKNKVSWHNSLQQVRNKAQSHQFFKRRHTWRLKYEWQNGGTRLFGPWQDARMPFGH
jgi:hypothetical protein